MQTLTNTMNNTEKQPQHLHHHHPPPTPPSHQHLTHQSSHEDQQILPEHHHQQQHQHHLQHQGYAGHIPSTMPASSSITPPLISLNEGLYTPAFVTSESSSQYCSSSEVSFLNCNTSSSSASSSNDSNSPCLSPASSNSSLSEKKSSTPSIGVNLRVTGQCSQGGRKYMEDYFSVAYQQSENAKDLEYAFIGIYDGHGGAEAATFAKEHLMMEIINQRLFWSDSDHDVLRAIREGYIATHYAMWREQDKWPKTANGLPSTAGTTATVAFIRREKIYIGHVGDSGIVLGYQNEHENFWRAKQLTVDHKPESVEERTRIMKSGGKVVVKSGVPRVVWNRPRNASHRGPIKHKTPVDEIPFLAVARSLGDLWSYNSERNEFVVSPDPDVKVIPINPNTFRCLIFGTDGLWNVVNAQEAVNTVREKEVLNEHLQAQRGDCPNEGNQWTNPSKSLVDQALKTWSAKKMRADNTSVVTVILYPPGQGGGGHNNTNQMHQDVRTTPPAFIQPASYGLEYTQVQAEIPTYDDATTYKEMAMKYLPPEEYRNFNYYAEESDHGEEGDTDESDGEESDVPAKPAAVENVSHNNYQLQSNTWNWQHTSTINQSINHHIAEEEPGYAEDGEEAEDDEDDVEEDEDEEEDVEDAAASILPTEREVCVIDYQNYLQMDTEEANNATDSYINTFAESYNTLLSTGHSEALRTTEENATPTTVTATITPSNSNSNSSSNTSNCQSVSPPNMHALIEEQQLYQQQCMSEEDGYSLTKLETRREQQSCKSQGHNAAGGVETFKIFHHANVQHQHQPNMAVYSSNTEGYYQQHTAFMPPAQQKPLELLSLLQQEREEEQQVAYERQQMQNKLSGSHEEPNITTYACLQAVRHDSSSPSATTYVSNHTLILPSEEKDPNLMDVDDLIEEVTDVTVTEEASVQIHEISSSSACTEDMMHEIDDELQVHCETFMNPDNSSTTSDAVIEKIEKIEILQEVPYEVHNPSMNRTIPESENNTLLARRKCLALNKATSCLPPSSPSIVLTPQPVKSCKRSRSFVYGNVQNENLERFSSKANHSLYNAHSQRRSLSMTPTCSNKPPPALIMTPPAASSTPMIQRQLRSNSSNCHPNTTIDYGKRTLRTRNSLSKDMKSKSALVQAALKYPHNAVTRKFLQRNGSATILVGNPVLLQEQHMTPTNRRSLNTNTNGRSVSRSIKTRNNSTNTPLPQTSHHLNLRSRQSTVATTTPGIINLNNTGGNLNVSPPPPPPSSASSTPVIKRACLPDRRTLRSMHTRSSSRIGPPAQANFSKTTRSQSTGTNLAAPPPSPKMMNTAAAVAAAATRARSLISQKHAAEANGGTPSVVSAVFGKRVNLRSNGLTQSAAAMVSASNSGLSAGGGSATLATSATHQTLRGRVVKKFKR